MKEGRCSKTLIMILTRLLMWGIWCWFAVLFINAQEHMFGKPAVLFNVGLMQGEWTCAMTASARSNWWLIQYTVSFYLQMMNLPLVVFKGKGSWKVFLFFLHNFKSTSVGCALNWDWFKLSRTPRGFPSKSFLHIELDKPKVIFVWIAFITFVTLLERKINTMKRWKYLYLMLKLKPTQQSSKIWFDTLWDNMQKYLSL